LGSILNEEGLDVLEDDGVVVRGVCAGGEAAVLMCDQCVVVLALLTGEEMGLLETHL
jgi:hypothetical protein